MKTPDVASLREAARAKPLAPGELIGCFVGLSVIIAGQILTSGTIDLLTHPLWLDECLTELIANDPSFTHAMQAIRGGVETNPPTFYLFLWPVGKLLGGWSAIALRLFALSTMLLAMTGLYAICRRYFDPVSSVIGVLAIWANPIIVGQAFQARFYGPWLAAAGWYCYWSLNMESDRRWKLIVRCVLAVIIATLHWFGAIAIVLLAAGEIFAHRNSPSVRVLLPRILPLLIGGLALLACAPFYLGQRAGLTVSTWVDPTTPTIIRRVFVQLFFMPPFLLVLAAYAFHRIIVRNHPAAHARLQRAIAPVSALVLFPIVVTIFSWLVQPALVARYLVLALVPCCVLIAWLASTLSARTGTWLRGALVPAMIFLAVIQLRARSNETALDDLHVAIGIEAIELARSQGAALPVVFMRRHEQYPLFDVRPDLAPLAAKLDFETSAESSPSAGMVYERDMARRVARFYPSHQLIDTQTLRKMDRFITIAPLGFEVDLKIVLPDLQIVRRSPEVYEVTVRR